MIPPGITLFRSTTEMPEESKSGRSLFGILSPEPIFVFEPITTFLSIIERSI